MHKWLCWIVLLLCFGVSLKTEAHSIENNASGKAILLKSTSLQAKADTILADSLKPRKHKLIAALLAFPLPGGVLGLHRWYLGSAGAMPLVYIATIGGGFAILPFIDFVLILLSKDVNAYAHNTRLFMWTKKKVKVKKK